MAASALTVTVRLDSNAGGNRIIHGGLAVGAGDYAAGGLDFGTALIRAVPGISAIASILAVFFTGISGNRYEYNRTTGKLIARVAAGTEVPDGASPAGLTGDTITFVAHVALFQ